MILLLMVLLSLFIQAKDQLLLLLLFQGETNLLVKGPGVELEDLL